jgi:tRNA(Ile)-lysidine synthase
MSTESRAVVLQGRFDRALVRLLPEPARVLAAVSGGGDSVALLRLLAHSAARRALHLEVAHFHHGLRGTEADADAELVAELAKTLGLTLHLGRRCGGARSEESLRRDRRRFLEELAAHHELGWIALGHTREDQAETLLLQLMRGAGILGLAGMPDRGPGPYLRPLLGFSREELREYLRAHGGCWREDSSNRDSAYARNRLRNLHFPRLARDFNPRLAASLAHTAQSLGRDARYLEREGRAAFERLVQPAGLGVSALTLDHQQLRGLDPALQVRVARLAIDRLVPGAMLGHARLEELLNLIETGVGAVSLPRRAVARIRHGRLELRPARAQPLPASYAFALAPGDSIPLAEFGLVLSCRAAPPPSSWRPSPTRAWLDPAALDRPLEIRPLGPADRYRPLGAPGAKPARRLLGARRIDPALRKRWPVVASGARLVWIPGLPVADEFRISPATSGAWMLEAAPASRPEVAV